MNIRALFALVRKDLLHEYRSREIVIAMLVFAFLVMVIFNFALELNKTIRETVAVGVLWVTFVFAATLGLNRVFAAENDQTSLDGLLLAPIDRTIIFAAKFISTLIFVLLVQVIIVPLFSMFYSINLFDPLFLLTLFLGTVGYVIVGTLIAALALKSRSREILLPILLLPVSIPLMLAVVKAGKNILEGAEWALVRPGFSFIVAFDVIFIAVAIMTFDYLLEE